MNDLEKLLAELEKLKAENAQLRAQASLEAQEGSAIASGTQAKAVATGGTLIEGNVYLGPKTDDPTEALHIYRQVLVQTTTHLPLRGVDIGAADPTTGQKPLGLVHVYVDLDTTVQERLEPERKTRKDAAQDPTELLREAQAQPLSVLKAVISNPKMVLLGDPGSGKSTFVNFLAHCLAAHGLEPQAGWLEHLQSWPKKEADALPILLVLREFAGSLPETLPARAEPRHLWDFLAARLDAQNLDFALKPLHHILEEGHALVLLDGLDEISTLPQRVFVREAVRAFIRRYPRNRYLITCRVLSYQPPERHDKPDLRLPEFPDFTLAPFDETKLNAFVEAWYLELARLGTVTAEDAPGLTARLKEAIHRPDLWRLASNPLLLTVMALVHTHKGRLPEARALLYEETVEILLWRWEQIKQGGRADAPPLRQLLLEAGRTDVDLKRILWELAYEAHAGITGDVTDDQERLADIGELRLQKALAALKDGDLNWATEIVKAMKLRAGLLLERTPEIFTFPHRTFQEYLAGAHLATQANFAKTATGLAEQGALWREVILLAAGKLVYLSGDLDKPLALVGELCPAQRHETPQAWKKAWLAGDVLLEMGLKRVQDSTLGQDLLARVQQRLANLLEKGALTFQERARAGNTLATLGDPRFDPDCYHLPQEPLLGFVEIPAGPFVMGSDPKQDSNAQDDEQPQHTLELPTYWLAPYPVTVAQFRAFVTESDEKIEVWSGNTIPNSPVQAVTWHDALKYCAWLNHKLKDSAIQRVGDSGGAQRAFWEGLASGKLHVTLPSEAEWEKAARGGLEVPTSSHEFPRIYPWDGPFSPDHANTGETGLNTTSTVGCFPLGASPYGLLDMSGNVWEWTRTLWGKDWQEPDFKYPYRFDDGRENFKADNNISRVLRGGSFNLTLDYARCAFRDGSYPLNGDGGCGFRVVVSPSS